MLRNLYNYYFGEPQDEGRGRPVYIHGPVMHRLTLGYILLAIGVVSGLWLFQRQADKVEKLTLQSHRALCIQKTNAQRQVFQTKAYVESDTDGFVFGIPTPVLQRSIRVNQATVKSLSDVDCD